MVAGTCDAARATSTIVVATKQKTAAAVKKHARALEIGLGPPLTTSKSVEHVSFETGCTVDALPGGNPDALRGFEGNLILDEAAFVVDADAVFKAGWSVAGPTIARPEGYRLSMISTPAGVFWRAVEGDLRSQWSQHKIDIYDAVRGGSRSTPRQNALQGDADAWQSEALCDFLAADGQYPAELYDACALSHVESRSGDRRFASRAWTWPDVAT